MLPPLARTMTPYFALDAALAIASAAVTIAASQSPDRSDMVAVLGAMLATVIATLEARKKDRTLGNTITVLVGSAFVGSVAPGAVLFTWYADVATRLTWHVWAGLGFFSGLVGWGSMQAVVNVATRVRDAWLVRKFQDWEKTEKP